MSVHLNTQLDHLQIQPHQGKALYTLLVSGREDEPEVLFDDVIASSLQVDTLTGTTGAFLLDLNLQSDELH